MKFLQDITNFKGTGQRNANGQTLEEFLAEYDATKYQCPSNTVDNFIISCQGKFGSPEAVHSLLMIKRKDHPCIGYWALPGGFVEMQESLEYAAKRELQEETGLTGIGMEQIYTWGAPDRDPRTRVITTVYAAVLENGAKPVKAGDDAADAAWFELWLNKLDQTDAHKLLQERYELKLKNVEGQIELQAIVERKYRADSLIRQEQFTVISSQNIAADHGAVIAQAFLKLQREAELKA